VHKWTFHSIAIKLVHLWLAKRWLCKPYSKIHKPLTLNFVKVYTKTQQITCANIVKSGI
jgi:hypothetical protein